MKIAIITPYLPPEPLGIKGNIYSGIKIGGAEKWAWDLITLLGNYFSRNRERFRLEVFTSFIPPTGNKKILLKNNIIIHRLSPKTIKNNVPTLGSQLTSFFVNNSYEVIHFILFLNEDFLTVVNNKKIFAKILFSHHGVGPLSSEPKYKNSLKEALKRIDFITLPSLSSLKHYIEFKDIIAGKSIIINNGIVLRNPKAYDKTKIRKNIIKISQLAKKNRIFLYLGRILEHKGIDLLIQAFNKLKKEQDNILLIISGTGPIEEVSFLKKLASENSKHIIFTGYLTEPEKHFLLENSYALVLPSRTILRNGNNILEPEALGIVLLEASIHKKLIIGSDCEGIRYFIKDGITGFLFKSNEYKSLFEVLKKSLKISKKTYKSITENAYLITKTQYNWDSIIETIVELYQK